MSVHNSVHNTLHNSDDEADPNNQAVTLISKLDLSHPLHLHPNDSTTFTIVSIKIKGTENYNVWSCAMLLALEGRNKIGFIDNTCRRSYTDEVLGRQWDRVNVVVMGWILNSILEELCFKLIGYPADCGKRNNISNTNQNTQNFNRIFMNNNNSVGSSSTSGLSDEQTKLLSLIKDNSLNDRGKGVQANMAGANQHLTYTDKNLVNVIDISYLRIRVSHPNGTEALITKVGNLKLTNFLTLYDVTVVPEYSVTLVSIHKVARDNKFIVGFDESKCFLMVVNTEGHRMPSSVLKGKSPYQLVFNKNPSLKHLRVFGCLCFATILNNHDKFSCRAEKCVFIGYSSFKKGYKLFSLERKQFVFSKDVKFFENVFPFKIRHSSVDKVSQDLDHVNFFDEIVHEGPDTSYDDNDINAHDQSDGSNSSNPGSPTIDLCGKLEGG
ncbi:ribonuclease H-like domain-containing protein [Tanacetum coccineum]|uniref:Ribonuclease H-like domain-containing protein n=1 Tax=Tanacetum coccineum TaxID=301880 RepID=A0ABQ4Y6X4_9ASTR